MQVINNGQVTSFPAKGSSQGLRKNRKKPKAWFLLSEKTTKVCRLCLLIDPTIIIKSI